MFREGLIYKLVCNKTGMFYIGSTENYEQRKRQHKCLRGHTCKSKLIIEKNDYRWELIKDGIEFLFTVDLEWYEAKEIKNEFKNPLCINQCIPRRTNQEWAEDNREKSNQIKRDWANRNKDRISKKPSVKVQCECGSIVTKRNISTHKKSDKHKTYLRNNSTVICS